MDTSASSSASNNHRPFRLFSLRTLGCFVVGVVAIATLVGLFFVEEDWRGKHAWENYESEAEARGVDLNFADFIPAPVPDDQNFAMTPFLKPLFDFNPKPLQPGQSAWRDTNGYNRIMNFATNRNLNGPSQSALSVIGSGHLANLPAIAGKMANLKDAQTNSLTSSAAAQIVLDNLAQYQPVLDEINDASHRPYIRFNIGYNDEDPAAILLPHLAVIKRLTMVYQLQASANLALNRTDAAAADEKIIFYLANAFPHEPFMISILVRCAELAIDRQVIWEGLAQGKWSDAQLQEFEERYRKLDFARDARQSLDSERAAFGVRLFDYIRANPSFLGSISDDSSQLGNLFSFVPKGWIYLEQVSYNRGFDRYVLPGFDPRTGQAFPKEIEKAGKPESQNPMAHLLHHDILISMLLPSVEKFYPKIAIAETGVNETIAACAIERYRLANGKLPDTLDQLVPKFLDQVPMDVCNGKPLIYHPGEGRNFTLYSVGWNQTDDGGKTVHNSTKTENSASPIPSEGDWVWPSYAGE
ncbi:MAG TPA: hypothetical protein VH413_04480 [Verrucomicrobiae bacterium]|jgi:hypothetical protein|nr:hypothetical protein [Verrucomicrobiae bacterium]